MIGKIIKYMRTENNISQEKLGIMTNIGRSTISDYEREKTDIDFDKFNKIAQMCDYEILFKDKKNKKIITLKDIERNID